MLLGRILRHEVVAIVYFPELRGAVDTQVNARSQRLRVRRVALQLDVKIIELVAAVVAIKRGGIVVDDNCLTSDENIYAIGDCAQSVNLITGKHEYWPLGSISTTVTASSDFPARASRRPSGAVIWLPPALAALIRAMANCIFPQF